MSVNNVSCCLYCTKNAMRGDRLLPKYSTPQGGKSRRITMWRTNRLAKRICQVGNEIHYTVVGTILNYQREECKV